MRKLDYLSPTSLKLFGENKEDFYLRYLSENRPDRFLQTKPMSVGSAFDAYVKSYLHEHLFGKGNNPKYELSALIEASVEPHNRDWALIAGKYAFDAYKSCGSLVDLMMELQGCVGNPRFEFEIRGVIEGRCEGEELLLSGVPFLGRPDMFFVNSHGAHVVLDFKVNGFCSNYNVSPVPGYVRLRPGGAMHRDCQPMTFKGITINVASFLESLNVEWADQLTIYSWLLGEDVGSESVVAIEQLACKPAGYDRPEIRVASHRIRVSAKYQFALLQRAQDAWRLINSDWFFRDVTKEESQSRCAMLDRQTKALNEAGSWFKDAVSG